MHHTTRRITRRLALPTLGAALFAAGLPAKEAASDYDLNFPLPLSSSLPYDVNIPALRSLSDTPDQPAPPYTIPDANIPAAQR
jgi:hypothetical protein